MLWKTVSKIIVVLLLVALLAGCVNEPGGTSVPVNTESLSVGSQPNSSQNTNPQPTGTQTPERDYRMPTVEENYWELLCENCDITMYLAHTRENFLMFPLLSAQDLSGKMMTVTTDQGISAEIEIYKEDYEADLFPFSTFLMYQDFDWTSLSANGGNYHILSPWDSKYQTVRDELPELYYTRMHLPFGWLGIDAEATEPQQIKTLTVTIDGQTKTYDLGRVMFMPGRVTANKIGGGGLRREPLLSGYSTKVSKDGILKLPTWDLTAEEDVVLQGISLPGSEGVTVVSCELVITTPFGDKFNMVWDANSPIEVDAGSKIQVELTLADPALASTMIANVLRYISLDYTRDGETYTALLYASCRVKADSLSVYAMKVDGIDMLPYYLEYKDYIG